MVAVTGPQGGIRVDIKLNKIGEGGDAAVVGIERVIKGPSQFLYHNHRN